MSLAFRIAPVSALHPDIEAIGTNATAEGFRFVDKLVKEWVSGKNKFDHPGELFVAAFQGDRILGFCGLNRDPYKDSYEIARLRHLYVDRAARRNGIGSALLRFIVDAVAGEFSTIRLRTDTREAAAFYARHGFSAVEDATATHTKALD